MSLSSNRLIIQIADQVATVTLNRPEQHNGVDLAMIQSVLAAQKQLRRRRDLRAIILTGEGPSFCAGLDFKSVLAKPARAAWMVSQLWWPFRNQFQQWSLGWRQIGVPVIACIHGNCFGAGLQLALGADIRFATPHAQLSLMEAKWGLIPDMGGATLLPELMPIDRAKEITLTGRLVSGQEALALGLVTHVADDPLAAARAWAVQLANRSPDACAAGKHLLHTVYRSPGFWAESAERLWQSRLIGRTNFRIALRRNQTARGSSIQADDSIPESQPTHAWRTRRLV